MAQRPSVRSPASGIGRLPPGWRLPIALSLYLLVSVAVFGGIAAHVFGQRLAERDLLVNELRHELERREVARHALEATLDELRRSVDARDRKLAMAAAEGGRLATMLAQATTELAALEGERDRARERARLLDRGARESERWLETAQSERLTLERERVALEERLAEVEARNERALNQAERLRWRLEIAEHRVAELEAEGEATARWLAAWIGDRLGTLEAVLERTGIEPDRLTAPAAGHDGSGLGGPLLPLPGGPLPAVPDRGPEPSHGGTSTFGLGVPLMTSMASDLDRLLAVERLLAAVPLATPLDHYHLTSGYGRRIDPLTRRQALHNGLDFGAAAGSEVLATAPGRVTHAGRAGSYGIMVEIDHGHGISTRYAHLSRALVEAGDRVPARDPIGIIGSTGRSTGRHLHYEVRLDGAPRDPARFIAAGRQLIEAIGS